MTRLGVQPAEITQLILIVLVLGAGTDYGLFLTFRVREELRRGLAPKEAVVRAVQTVGETITFSALTVIAALLTLVIAQFGIYQSLGPALAIGIALMLLAGLTLLPALLAIFGRAVFWPTSTQKREHVAAGLWGRLTGRLMQRPGGWSSLSGWPWDSLVPASVALRGRRLARQVPTPPPVPRSSPPITPLRTRILPKS